MRRLLTASALAAVVLTAVTSHFAEALSVASDGEPLTAQTEETVTPGGGPSSVPSEAPARGDEPARFDSLWVVIVGVVGLLLLIGIVRTQRRWDSSPHPGEQSGNENGSRGVLGDE